MKLVFWFMPIGLLLYAGNEEQANAANLSQGNKWAVVIGIEKYDHEQDLTYAVDDAEAMGASLEALGFKVLSLTDGKATRKQILDLLEVDLRKLVKQKEDQVVIYFSGHGVTHPEEGLSRIGYIVPVEATRSRVYDEGIGMERLARYAKSLPAQQVLFLLDACYSGMAGTQEKSLPALSEQRLKRLLREPGKYIMVAGSGNQESLEGPEWRHGLFTHFLLNGLGPDKLADLNGDQLVTVGELFEYVKPRVEDEAVIQGKPQVPELWKLTGDQGQLAFVYEKVPGKIPVPIPGKLPKTITGKDGAPMVLVPEGAFMMGSSSQDIDRWLVDHPINTRSNFVDEVPQHRVTLDAFYIDQYEVTTSRYASFMQAAGRPEPKNWSQTIPVSQAEKPVVGVSWEDAQAYCQHYDKRLPTEAEWEKAARGTDGRTYPWGNALPTTRHANVHLDYSKGIRDFDNYGVLTEVGSLPAGASPYGAHDMSGNVWEWVADWYGEEYYVQSPEKNPKGPEQGKYRVVRGGSWYYGPFTARSADRYDGLVPTDRLVLVGFRCVQDAP